MIRQLTDLIQKHPEWLRQPGAALSFLSGSTPASGKKHGTGKVLLFVFENGQKTPTLCVKTTRAFAAQSAVKKNYDNLQLLTDGVRGTTCAEMFAKPLYSYEEKNTAFCVESVCSGDKFSAKCGPVHVVLGAYQAWQKELVERDQKSGGNKKILLTADLEKIALDTIDALKLAGDSARKLRNYFQKLSLPKNIRVPAVVQHGDMTPDNVLISGSSVFLIDYDYVGVSMVAGFDLFHFLSKTKERGMSFRSRFETYFPAYLTAVGATVESYDALLFIYYVQESLRKGYAGKNGDEIIEDFEALLNRV